MSYFAIQLNKTMRLKTFILVILLSTPFITPAQHTASEDSMLSGNKPATFLGGYGSFYYQRNGNEKKSNINLERIVLFLGHRFNDKFSFFSEIEIEDAKIEGGEEGGELAFEQAYIKFNLSKNSYLAAGLFLPRIGILNENHLPNTFNGNERTRIERLLIPSTWRELGIGYYTSFDAVPIDLSFAIVNGLNSSAFEHGTGIRGGRYEGSNATANNLAFTGALNYSMNNFSFQVSAYAGGTVGFSNMVSDSLNLDSGPLGTPVILGEADVQYRNNGFGVKVLAATFSIPDADKINMAFANNTPESAYGFYAEFAYDFLYSRQKDSKKSFIGFLRYEMLDLNSSIPANGIIDPVLEQKHIIAGISYLPIPNIAVKADVRLSATGEENPALIINPDPTAPPFNKENTFINLGIGFSF